VTNKAITRKSLLLNGLLGAAVVAVAVTAYVSVGTSSSSNAAVATAQVARGTVVSSVSATGNVSANRDIGLSFGGAGTVTDVLVKPGDKVAAGRALAHIDGTDAKQALTLAKTQLASAQAKLADDLQGLTPVERAQLDISEQQAAQSLKVAQTALDNANANAALDKVTLQTALDQATSQLDTDTAQYTTDSASLVTAEATMESAQSSYDVISTQVNNEQLDKADCPGINPGTRTNLQCSTLTGSSRITQDQQTQSADASALSDAKSNYNTLNNAVTSEKSKVASDTNAVTNATNSQTAGLLKDQQAITNAQNSLDSANLSLQATQAGDLVKLEPAKASQIDTDRAGIITAQTSVTTAQKAFDKTAIVAPVAATVSSVAGAAGDAVGSSGTVSSSSSSSSSSASSSSSSSSSSSGSSTTGFVVLTDVSTLQVKAGFSEADAAKIQNGQSANVTFDALPNTTVAGQVVTVDPTSTVVNNVVTYNVTVVLTQTAKDVKPGMTASVQVIVDKVDNVLELPSSAVTGTGNTSFVTLQNGKVQERRTVATGLKGDDTTEIVSGLKLGDVVVTSTSSSSSSNLSNLTNRLRGAGTGGLGGGGIVVPAGGR